MHVGLPIFFLFLNLFRLSESRGTLTATAMRTSIPTFHARYVSQLPNMNTLMSARWLITFSYIDKHTDNLYPV